MFTDNRYLTNRLWFQCGVNCNHQKTNASGSNIEAPLSGMHQGMRRPYQHTDFPPHPMLPHGDMPPNPGSMPPHGGNMHPHLGNHRQDSMGPSGQGGYPPQGSYPTQGSYPPQGGYPPRGGYPYQPPSGMMGTPPGMYHQGMPPPGMRGPGMPPGMNPGGIHHPRMNHPGMYPSDMRPPGMSPPGMHPGGMRPPVMMQGMPNDYPSPNMRGPMHHMSGQQQGPMPVQHSQHEIPQHRERQNSQRGNKVH